MRSSVAETVPTQHVREVDYQLTRVMRTISGTLVATIPPPLIQVLVYTIAQPQIRRREASDPNDHRGTCPLYARCQIRTYPSPSVRWQTQVLVEPTSTMI